MPGEKMYACVGLSGSCVGVDSLPFFSEKLEAAWRVVEKFKAVGVQVEHNVYEHDVWQCGIDFNFGPDDFRYEAQGETAPLAICRAALKACWTD